MSNSVVLDNQIEDVCSAIKQYTLSELLILSQAINTEISNLQGGASYAVFTGATSNTGGASGIVPAPAAGDDDKFLCGNGEWVTIQSGGGSYPIATSLEAGLMSAEDKQHLDSVFQSSADFADAVLTGVGGKFIPSVSSVSDYMYFKDSNIQFFDSKLQRLCNTILPTDNYYTSLPLMNGQTTVYISRNGNTNSLVSSMYGSVSLPSGSSSIYYEFKLRKISETKSVLELLQTGKSHSNTVKAERTHFYLKDTGQITLADNISSIVSGGSASVNLCTYWLPSLKNAETYAILSKKETLSSGDAAWSISAEQFIDNGNISYTNRGANTSIGTYYGSSPSNTTDVEVTPYFLYNKPKLSYSNNSITVSRQQKSIGLTPFFRTREWDYNSSKSCIAERRYLWCVHGANKSPTWSKILFWSYDSVNGSEFPIPGFDADFMVGCYSDRTRTNWYLITCVSGTYPYSATWIDSCFKVWYFDPRSCDIQPCSKTLSQILPDLIL